MQNDIPSEVAGSFILKRARKDQLALISRSFRAMLAHQEIRGLFFQLGYWEGHDLNELLILSRKSEVNELVRG